ncbi:hypothetical protein E3N88_14998 [Mikania micrantha]|uniref:Uncharacterized protein n=1 Tax=Mikania micrantha TaxID=192012 RepID=A0A5N6P4G1_9ASTR|nr:hypothetical protein E3N88_14998 [Mikania micrantha]
MLDYYKWQQKLPHKALDHLKVVGLESRVAEQATMCDNKPTIREISSYKFGALLPPVELDALSVLMEGRPILMASTEECNHLKLIGLEQKDGSSSALMNNKGFDKYVIKNVPLIDLTSDSKSEPSEHSSSHHFVRDQSVSVDYTTQYSRIRYPYFEDQDINAMQNRPPTLILSPPHRKLHRCEARKSTIHPTRVELGWPLELVGGSNATEARMCSMELDVTKQKRWGAATANGIEAMYDKWMEEQNTHEKHHEN